MSEFAIVLLNYNSWEDSIECLESLFKLEYPSFKIFLVDNSDENTSIKKIIKWCDGGLQVKKTNLEHIVFPLIKKPISYQYFNEDNFINSQIHDKLVLIKSNQNKGFAAGNNIVLNYITKIENSFDWIWILNNDTVVKPDILKNIYSEVKTHAKEKILFGTPLLEYSQPNTIQALGGRYNRYLGLTYHNGQGFDLKKEQLPIGTKIDYPIGASMIISKFLLQNLGVLSEDYFLFYEELDWAMRLKNMNGKVKILNLYGVYHKQGAATKTKTTKLDRKSEFIDLLSLKNRIRFSKKYFKKYTWSVAIFILLVSSTKRLILGDFSRALKIYKLVKTELSK